MLRAIRQSIWSVSVLSLGWLMMSGAEGQEIITSSTVVTSQPTMSVTSGGELYYCAKCGAYHVRSSSTPQGSMSVSSPVVQSPVMQSSVMQSPVMQTAGSYLASTGGTSNVLSALNAQRARQGLGSLAMDPQLQAVAERRAQLMASSGLKSHPPGSYAPGRYEGVGWSSSYTPSAVSACFTSDPNMRVAGAAMATGRDGVYFCVVYR